MSQGQRFMLKGDFTLGQHDDSLILRVIIFANTYTTYGNREW